MGLSSPALRIRGQLDCRSGPHQVGIDAQDDCVVIRIGGWRTLFHLHRYRHHVEHLLDQLSGGSNLFQSFDVPTILALKRRPFGKIILKKGRPAIQLTPLLGLVRRV
ncbi:hypothetical protein [Haloferula rosea]|uniref:Uncharacterized protein n=1 Tax=Haloferula rosea TaxID=490093 RepID=A0A934RA82_9BACT|nr:hypothetical protein [Haloferula rosea]MBK1826883.1 hypothetical protein [Haloferula rosea]